MSAGILLVAVSLSLAPSAPPTEAQTARLEEIAAKMSEPGAQADWYAWSSAMLKEGENALPAILKLLQGKSPNGRANAAWVLMKRGKPFPEAVAPLVEILKGEDESGKGYASAALSPNGPKAADAVPHLIPLVSRLRHTAGPIMALEAIGIDAKYVPEVVREIVKLGPGHSASSQMFVAVGLKGLPEIAGALAHDSSAVRTAAAEALGKLGKPAKTPAVEAALNAALKRDDTRVSAARALVDIGASAKAAIPGLIDDLEKGRVVLLRTTDLRYEFPAAEVLSRIPEAVPALLAGLDDDRENVRIGCLLALPSDGQTKAKFLAKVKAILASEKTGGDVELAVVRLYDLDPEWVARAVGNVVKLPPRHWHTVVPAMVAASKAEKK